jgi:hypothetical protein
MAEIRNALMPYAQGTGVALNWLWNGRPGHVNQSDGSVGIVGKAIGELGLDLEGRRAATSWEDAWRNTVDADTTGRTASMLPIRSDGGYAVPTLVAAPFEGFERAWERGDEANISNPDLLEKNSMDSFDAAGGAMTGGLAAGALGAVPEGAIASNGIGRNVASHAMNAMERPKPYGARLERQKLNVDDLIYTDEAVPTDLSFVAQRETQPPAFVVRDKDGTMFLKDGHHRAELARQNGTDLDALVIDKSLYSKALAHKPGTAWPDVAYSALKARGFDDAAGELSDRFGSGQGLYDFHENWPYIAANPKTGAAVPLALDALDSPKGFTAYHGSPHDFDRFDLSKIGTGEGAQAYGHGLYFAESEGVAKWYRERLAARQTMADVKLDGSPDDIARHAVTVAKGDLVQALKTADDFVQWLDSMGPATFGGAAAKQAKVDGAAAAAAALRDRPQEFEKAYNPGHMYEVNIKADPDSFLDWDAPVGQQTHLLDKLRALAPDPDKFDKTQDGTGREFMEWVGASDRNHWYHSEHPEFLKSATERTKAIREAGIPGIRYLDQGSRGAGQGSRNYVLFDDSLVDIKRKYANHPFGSAAPLAFSDYDEPPRNALMPPKHRSATQPRDPAGRFSK